MSIYAIGDIQGCYQELLDLLDKINFNQNSDQLLFTGDLVNRGPCSLEVIRFVKALGNTAVTVLGNHDLHLLAVAHNAVSPHRNDTLDDILLARDRQELLDWLRTLPFIHTDQSTGFNLLHAGLAPQWNLKQAKKLAHEVEHALQGRDYVEFLHHMYGNQPDHWSDDLEGRDRLRVIINAYTRLRYCDGKGRFALKEKGPPGSQPEKYLPWFAIPDRKTKNEKIIFGHWSTVHLGNIKNFGNYNVYPLDTGCLWGGSLTALRLEDEKYISVPSRQARIHRD